MTRECHGLLKVAGTPEDPARIINTSSVAGLGVTEAWVIAYSASKSAVNQITKILARHLGNDNIAVNAIAPGMFPTKMSQVSKYTESSQIIFGFGELFKVAQGIYF
jgi:NAD(P)-dependent dehydrogenase (short-subunit alcohol dehydrogenase family)